MNIYDFSSIQKNQIKEFNLENGDCVIVYRNKNDEIFASSAYCTHYGAPLIKGVINNGIIRCPWHGACFNAQTGDIEDFPGLDNLKSYKVKRIEDEFYEICDTEPQISKKYIFVEKPHFCIIGSGPCALICAETLRKHNFGGKITILTSEKYLPYDRPKLSKNLCCNPSELFLRTQEFFAQNAIDISLQVTVRSVDFINKTIYASSGYSSHYDKLLIAMGSTPVIPNVQGSNLSGIYALRSMEDAKRIQEKISLKKHVVVLGSAFIGMELASTLMGKVKSLTVVTNSKVPFERIFGLEIGAFIQNLHVKNGVQFKNQTYVTSFEGDKRVEKICLSNGTCLPCNLCILGLGVNPATDIFKLNSQTNRYDKFMTHSNAHVLDLNPKGFISVNEFMETNIPDVYAGGDLVNFPLYPPATINNLDKINNETDNTMQTTSNKVNFNGRNGTIDDSNHGSLDSTCDMVNIPHWQMAHKHGQIAALNMLNMKTPLNTVPFFWTTHFGKTFRYVGHVVDPDQTIIHADVHKTKLVAYYMKDSFVNAVLTFNRDPVASIFAELMRNSKHIAINSQYLAQLEPLFDHGSYIDLLKFLLNMN